MSSDTEIDYDDVPFDGIRTRSQRAAQSVRRTLLNTLPPERAPQLDSETITPFDHVFLNLIGWNKNDDCYQTLVQNHFTSIRSIINNFTSDIAETLKYTHPTLNRIFAPPVAIKEVQSFLYFIAKFTDYYQTSEGEEYFLRVTTDQYETFRKQYALENFEASQRTRSFSPQNVLAFEASNRDSPTSFSASIRPQLNKADAFRRERRDQSVYKVFKHDSQWLTWVDSTRRQVQAQQCAEILDPDYTPRTEEDELLLQEQNRYMIAVWDTVLKTDTARQILAKYSDSSDSQAVFVELVEYYTKSTHAKINSRELLCSIFSTRLDPNSYSDSYEKFILDLQDKIRSYERQTPVEKQIPEKHKMTIFQIAVKSVPCLNNVIIQADGIQAQTGKMIAYTEYLELLYGAAQVHDNEFKLGNKKTSKVVKRNVYKSEVCGYDSDDASVNSGSDDFSYEAYVTKTRRSGYSPRLTKDQWHSLTEEDKKIWDQLSDSAKSLIMSRKSPIPSRGGPQTLRRKVNLSDMTIGEFTAHVHDLSLADNEVDSIASNDDNTDANSKITVQTSNTSSSKHPGALKHLLSDEKKGPSKETRSVKYSQRLAFLLNYSVSTNEIFDHVLKPSLIDRGANGGVGGEDVRLLSHVPGRTVTIQGIDNHQMNSVRVGTVGGVVESTRGPLLLIFHQYAYTGRGATIHSAIQMESFGCKVDDRSILIGGTQQVVTPHGYVLPLAFVDGLARLSLRPPTMTEIDDLLHEIVTSEVDWDPRIMDSEIDDYGTQGTLLPLEQDVGPSNLFDEYGDYRDCNVATSALETAPSIRDLLPRIRDILADHPIVTLDVSAAYLMNPPEDSSSESDSCSETECESTSTDSQDSLATRDVSFAYQYVVQNLNYPIESTVPSDVTFIKDANDDLLDNFAQAVFDKFTLQAYQIDQQVTTHPTLVRKYPDFDKIRPQFAFQPTAIVQKTFENTTQLARMSEGTVLKKHYKSPNPALNVERRQEAIATYTIFANVKAINLGITEAQIFVGVKTLVTNVFPLKSQSHFAKVLMDAIIMHGAPTKLISDSAKAETSEKEKDICRTLIIPQWQSEANHQHQNYAERRIQDLKRISNTVLDRTGAPDDLWFECFNYVCDVLNHSYNERLQGIPLQLLDGHTPDISPFLLFYFYQRVLYRVEENSFLLNRAKTSAISSESPKTLGTP